MVAGSVRRGLGVCAPISEGLGELGGVRRGHFLATIGPGGAAELGEKVEKTVAGNPRRGSAHGERGEERTVRDVVLAHNTKER